VSILAVRSGAWFWLRALVRGRFSAPPAVRLSGVVGERREATPDELARIRRRFRGLRFTRGYGLLWKSLGTVRDVEIHAVEPVILGAMTTDRLQSAGEIPQGTRTTARTLSDGTRSMSRW
jgi:uncharacterized protein